jgi:hypothetical protein
MDFVSEVNYQFVVRKTFVIFKYQIRDGQEHEVKDRSLENVILPRGAYGFQFFDRLYSYAIIERLDTELISKPLNHSKVYCPKERKLTDEEVRQLDIRCPHNPSFEARSREGAVFIKIGSQVSEELLACDVREDNYGDCKFVDVKVDPS